MIPRLDLTGQRFGLLVAVAAIESPNNKTYWTCKCDCGRIVKVRIDALRKSNSQRSCGCEFRRIPPDGRKFHGRSGTPEHYVWNAMKMRCTDPSSDRYDRYGGRGITVCDRWLNSFSAFLEDMGDRPSSKHSLERINNNASYCPENCVWASREVQANNKSNNRRLTHDGRSMTLSQWARHAGLSMKLLWKRLDDGWPMADALGRPKFVRKNAKRRSGERMPVEIQRALRREFGDACAYCDQKSETWDHVVPISNGGSRAIHNVVPACWPCNRSKRDHDVWAWIDKTGRHLSERSARYIERAVPR